MEIERVLPETLEQEAKASGIELPIEQTALWADFQGTIEGRSPWNMLLVRENQQIVAVMSLIAMHTHGYQYLRAPHGPVWKNKPTQEQERDLIQALSAYIRLHDKQAVFLRMETWYDEANIYPVLSTVPYNETVVIDLTGDSEDILSRMKSRGRRDVRKAIRECPATLAEETDQALTNFDEYYAVMKETAQRDGFEPAPESDYTDMLEKLGRDHCRVFAARIDGKVVAWSMVTIQGSTAVYYYASMLTEVKRQHVPDRLIFFIATTLSEEGIDKLDLMGIGNDFAPTLMTLNNFKTKFSKETTTLAGAHDIALRKGFYSMLRTAQSLRKKLHAKK